MQLQLKTLTQTSFNTISLLKRLSPYKKEKNSKKVKFTDLNLLSIIYMTVFLIRQFLISKKEEMPLRSQREDFILTKRPDQKKSNKTAALVT